MAFSTFLALCLFCAASALALVLADNQWAKENAWLVPLLWGLSAIFAACTLAAARWFRRLFAAQEVPSHKAKETHGAHSPAMAVGSLGDIAGANVNIGGVQHVTNLPVSAQTLRPRVTVMSYERVDDDELTMSGYKEVLRLHIDGALALDVTVEPMLVGKWMVTFAGPINLQPGNGRIEVRSIRTVMHGNAGSSISTLDDAWRDASNGGTTLPQMMLRLSYRDFHGQKFATTCSLERDIIIRGRVPFRVCNCHDVPSSGQPSTPTGLNISPTVPILRVKGIGYGFLAGPDSRVIIQTVAIDNVQILTANVAVNVVAELCFNHPTHGKRKVSPFAWFPAQVGDQPFEQHSGPADISSGERINIPYVYKWPSHERVVFPTEREGSARLKWTPLSRPFFARNKLRSGGVWV